MTALPFTFKFLVSVFIMSTPTLIIVWI